MLGGRIAHTFACAALILALAAFAGCGGDDDDGNGNGNGAAKRDKPKDDEKPQKLTGDPLELADSEESIEDAVARIEDAVAADDCDKVNELNPLGRPNLSSEARCDYLTKRLDLDQLDSEEFKGGGVIDYAFGPVGASAIALLDGDGLYHVAYVDTLLEEDSVGTEYTDAHEEAAKQAVDALAKRDCKDFLELAHNRYGPGAIKDEDDACTYVENNPVARVFDSYPKAELKPVGGNGDYAFFTLANPAAVYTIVTARQADPAELPEQFDPLPKGAPDYAFVDAYLTNTPRGLPLDSGD